MTSKLFSELALSDEVLKAIDKLGFEQASPIQAEAIPPMMAGHDIVGQSMTGSGKTAAFAIPAIEKTDPQNRAVQVLILCPTRELAVQVSEEVHKLSLFKRGINALPIYGGQSYERQFVGLKKGAQIVIGTPGRVMDHMRRGSLKLDAVKLVVLDEADVMLNMGFREDIETILTDTPKERQTVFFSATMPRAIRDLINTHARDPKNVKIEHTALTGPKVEQTYYEVDRRFKVELLTRLIDIHDLKLGIIFCNTKRMVDDLVDHLEAQGYMADKLHGDMTQNLRDRVMNKFRKSGLEFLVATDVAARGIDVDDVQVVFNFDLPYDVEDYLHRIGRTGRAGRSGMAISFVAGREVFQIRNIERYTNTRIQRARIPTEAEVGAALENVFLGKLRTTLQAGAFRTQEHLVERLLEEGFSSTDIAAACLAHLQGIEEGSARPPQKSPPANRDEPQRPSPGAPDRSPRREPEPRGFPERKPSERKPARNDAPVRPPAPRIEPPRKPPVAAAPKPAPKPAVPPRPKPSAPVDVAPRVNTEPAPPRPAPAAPTAPTAPVAAAPKPEAEFARLHINVGESHGVQPGDIITAIAGETGLPTKVVGKVDIRENHLFVEVAAPHANAILSKLKRTQIRGKRVKVKAA